MRSFEEVAVNFASALVAGDFERARNFLEPSLRTSFSPAQLRARFFEMFNGYADGSPTGIQFDDEFSLVEWPSKQADDIGWAYVGVVGEGFVEAVSVTVSDVDGVTLIRQIEWGRP